MCNLFSMNADQVSMRALFKVDVDNTGNLPPQPGIHPDYPAPIVRNSATGRERMMARWGMPTPPTHLIGKDGKPRKTDAGVTNIRNVRSPHWRRWLGVGCRCLVPFTSFAEPDNGTFGSRAPVWFALDDTRPLACFAGIWTRWKSVRKVREGEVTADIFGFLTINPNAEVGAIHPKAMPVVLRTAEEMDTWMSAPVPEALKLQRPLPDGALRIVAHGSATDQAAAVAAPA
jgi:putative SOS response-associated peptidase YedK